MSPIDLGFDPAKVPAEYRWQDLRFPASGINPPGATSDAVRNTSNGLLGFSGTADNVVAIQAQLPHGVGPTIDAHLHLLNSAATAGDTRWKLQYKIADVNGDFPAVYSEEIITVAMEASAVKHQIAAFTSIDVSSFGDSAMIQILLSRLASSDAADNYAGTVFLLEFDIHYQIKSLGSIAQFGDH